MKSGLIVLLMMLLGASAQEMAPAFALQERSGTQQRLEDYRGKIVVLNFWATWCIPCKEEMPMLVKAHQRFADQGVTVIAVSLDDNDSSKQIPRFIKKTKMNMPIWVGATPGHLDLFRVGPALPATVFIDRDGKIVSRVLGQLRKEDLVPTIEWLLSDRTGTAPLPVIDRINPAEP